MVLRSLVLALIACSGAMPPAQAPTVVHVPAAPPQALCEFEGVWSTTLRFPGTDTNVSSIVAGARARLFSSTLEADVSGGGWHLRGHAQLSEDHALRVLRATWLGEGVAAGGGSDVSVTETDAGRVHVRPHPSALEHITLTEPPGRWLGCDAVGLALSTMSLQSLGLPRSSEAQHIAFPFSLSHDPGGPPFAEVRAEDPSDPTPMRAGVLRRRAGAAQIQVMRFVDDSNIILVGWTPESRLFRNPESRVAWAVAVAGNGTPGNTSLDADHEECGAPRALPLFVESALRNARTEAGHVDAGTQISVLERDAEWAEARPLRDIVLSDDQRFFVPSADLQCTTHHGTHLRTTQRVRVRATGLTCGAECECELELTRPHEGRGSCRGRLQCGTQVIFGERATNGRFTCTTEEGRVTGAVTAPSTASELGDPRFRLDGDVVSASDDEDGRLGAFSLEGRIIR